MVKISDNLRSLFLDPQTDSIEGLISEIQDAHDNLQAMTDTSKGTLKKTSHDAKSWNEDSVIPSSGVQKEDVPQLIAGLFHGVARWHSPHTMYNVAPPPLLPTVVSKLFTGLYNPNLVMETASGESLSTEQKVIESIARYIGWDSGTAGGSFTFGGKATSIYGLKVGIQKVAPNSARQGIKDDIVVFSTAGGHPSHISDAEWVGIGTDNVIRVATHDDSRISLEALEDAIRTSFKSEHKIAAIIISGGSTNNMVVDPIKDVVDLRDRLATELSMEYLPHIHVDAVVGFPWIFFKDYDFQKNELEISQAAAGRIKRVLLDLKDLYRADSFGIDFHKMGFCPYVSSLFMIKDKSLFSGSGGQLKAPFIYTIENSRSGDGPNSAYVALNLLGEKGFQTIIAHLTETALDLQNQIEQDHMFEVVNKDSLGASVMFVPILPAGYNSNATDDSITLRNNYTLRFMEILSSRDNPYYLDKVPGKSTGANAYPYIALKSYIMSPYANSDTNQKFVSYMKNLKREIDKNLSQLESANQSESEFDHPLK